MKTSNMKSCWQFLHSRFTTVCPWVSKGDVSKYYILTPYPCLLSPPCSPFSVVPLVGCKFLGEAGACLILLPLQSAMHTKHLSTVIIINTTCIVNLELVRSYIPRTVGFCEQKFSVYEERTLEEDLAPPTPTPPNHFSTG